MKMYNIEKQRQIVDLYSSGMPLSKVRGFLGLSRKAIKNVLKENGVELKSQSEQQRLNNGNSSLKQDAFETLTPESLYWIGFLYADGSIRMKSGRYVVSLDLSIVDEPHIEKLKNFLHSNHTIGRQERKRGDKVHKTSSLQISCERIHTSLANLGFTSDKTYTGHVHDLLKDSVDFWRGVIDGDGSISCSRIKRYDVWSLALCGTEHTIQSFMNFLTSREIPFGAEKPRAFKSSPTTFQTHFTGSVGIKVVELLYEGSELFLDRKKEAYEKWKAEEAGKSNPKHILGLKVLESELLEDKKIKIIYSKSHTGKNGRCQELRVGDLVFKDEKYSYKVLMQKYTTLICENNYTPEETSLNRGDFLFKYVKVFEPNALKILELFAGSRSVGKNAEGMGAQVFSVDWKKNFENIDLVIDVEEMTLKHVPFVPNVVWASPDCATYSIASCSYHRTNSIYPKSAYAEKCDKVNQHFISLIKQWLQINPNMIFFIENPVGMLRKMPWMQEFDRHTVWYCQYGDNRAKPTDIWTNSKTWIPKKVCSNGNYTCNHIRAPRGSKTGTQGRKDSYNRSKIPDELCIEILESVLKNKPTK